MSQQRAMKSALEHRKIAKQRLRVVTAEEAIREGRLSKVLQKAAAGGRNLQQEFGSLMFDWPIVRYFTLH